MTRGAKRKSPKVKALEGNPGRRANPPAPDPSGRLVCPSWLEGEAKELWMRLLPLLREMNAAGSADSESLAGMCQWWSDYLVARQGMADATQVIDVGRWAVIAARAWDRYAKTAQEFGLTPVSRNRLEAGPAELDFNEEKYG